MNSLGRHGYYTSSIRMRLLIWDFKALLENKTSNNIKVFRLENGGEYTSNEFVEFCKNFGIKKETIVPYNPE